MNGRTALGVLSLTLLLASCGQQTTRLTSTPSVETQRGQTQAPLLGTEHPGTIPDQYIVVLSDGAEGGAAGGNGVSVQSAGGLIRSLNLNSAGVTMKHLYSHTVKGFAGKLSAENLNILRADKRVKYIEQDQVMYALGTQGNPTWGLDRVDQRHLPLDRSYTYGSAAGVKAYILDTGININHLDFGGRATWGSNHTGDGNNSDCQGHGTHVAGTVGSSTYGVAKDVRLVAVKVLGCDGTGSNSGIIAGMDWVIGNKTGPSVVNMSLGPQQRATSQALDDAVARLYNNNVNVVVAAGNSGDDANYYSPARAPQAITVGNTNSSDTLNSSSNYGTALDLFAPGTSVTSTWYTSNTATSIMSGTSMASPHVAGAVALILGANPSYTAAQVTSALISNATTGKVINAGTGSPNRLLYTGTGGSTTPTPTPGGTTHTGTVSQGSSSYRPGSSGFTYAGGIIEATLSGSSGTDFDLFLQQWNGSAWADVARSEGSTSSESVTYSAGSGTYRWEVYAYSGSGSYTLVETK